MAADRPDMVSNDSIDVAIIGAGIIGLACAQKLIAAGRTVTLFDRAGIAREASYANASAFAFSDILPLATSGVLRKTPRWLIEPLGPLSIPPAYAFQIAPWLIRFWRAGWPDRMQASIAAQSALMRLAKTEMHALIVEAGVQQMVRSDGSLELYESENELRASEPGWSAREAENIAFEHVRGARLGELQPGLSAQFVAGTFVPGWETVTDPYDFACAIADHLKARGAIIKVEEIAAVAPAETGVTLRLQTGEMIGANQGVIAAGAWSKALTAELGDPVPLETERGYNTTLPPDAFDLRRQLIFGGHGFVITPLATGIRIGGAVELGGLKLKPNYARAQAMLDKAARFLPGLKTGGGRQWMGFRPSLPDSLPVIGPSRASERIVYAFGHGHLGLTQSAATGRLVADMLCGLEPAIDLKPYSPRRF
jgi:D-amino-acid dehydrogenase